MNTTPVGHIVPASAPAAALLPQLGRHGFAMAWAGGGFGYVEEHGLRRRIVLAADVRQPVAHDDRHSAPGGG